MSKPGRNDPCPCGSGKKHKKCCLQMQALQDWQMSDTEPLTDELIARLVTELGMPEADLRKAAAMGGRYRTGSRSLSFSGEAFGRMYRPLL